MGERARVALAFVVATGCVTTGCGKDPVVAQIQLTFDPFTCNGSSSDLGCEGEAGLYALDPDTGELIDSYCVSWNETVSPPRTSLAARLEGARLEGFAAADRVLFIAAVYPLAPTCVPPVWDPTYAWFVEPLTGLPAMYYGERVVSVDSVERIELELECFVTVGDIGCP